MIREANKDDLEEILNLYLYLHENLLRKVKRKLLFPAGFLLALFLLFLCTLKRLTFISQ